MWGGQHPGKGGGQQAGEARAQPLQDRKSLLAGDTPPGNECAQAGVSALGTPGTHGLSSEYGHPIHAGRLPAGAALEATSTAHQQSGEQRLLPTPSGSPMSHRHILHHLLHWGSPVRLVGSAAPPGTHTTSVGHVIGHVVTPQLPLEGQLMCAESGPPLPTIRPSGVSASEPLSRPLPGVSVSPSLSLSLAMISKLAEGEYSQRDDGSKAGAPGPVAVPPPATPLMAAALGPLGTGGAERWS